MVYAAPSDQRESAPDFVETPYVAQVTRRALGYVEAGFPVHFRARLRSVRQPWLCMWLIMWEAGDADGG